MKKVALVLLLILVVVLVGVWWFVSKTKTTMIKIDETVNNYANLANLDLPVLEERLGFKLEETSDSNEYFSVYRGYAPLSADKGKYQFKTSEVRISKQDSKNKLLILDFAEPAGVTQEELSAKYLNAQFLLGDPHGSPASLTVIEPWGKLAFIFNPDGRLAGITFDTID